MDSLTLRITHETAYAYSQGVSLAHHLAHLEPLTDAWQQPQAFGLSLLTEPSPQAGMAPLVARRHDVFGNLVHHLTLTHPHHRLVVRAQSQVRLKARFQGLIPGQGARVGEVAQALAYRAGQPFAPASEFVQPSAHTPLLSDLRRWAAPNLAPDRPVADAAMALMERLHQTFVYQSRSTEIHTPLQQVFDQRQGVCQDFAHLMIAALRAHGLAARYVSGYLLTHRWNPAEPANRPQDGAPTQAGADAGDTHLIGADATHAWVQVWCPETPGLQATGGWLDLDPTNRLIPSLEHVRVAVGRDFADVTPLRGVIQGGGAHTLTVGVHTEVVNDPS